MSKHTALEVSEHILTLVCEEAGDNMTKIQLQNLLYYCQGFHLAIYDKPLFGDKVVAQKLGAIIPSISEKYAQLHPSSRIEPPSVDTVHCHETQWIIGEVYKIYGQYTASTLTSMMQNEPWENTENDSEINLESMKTYFLTQIK